MAKRLKATVQCPSCLLFRTVIKYWLKDSDPPLCLKCGNAKKRKTHCMKGHPLTPENRHGRGCKTCHRAWSSAYHQKGKYGITVEQYREMLERQNGVCAICGGPETVTRFGRVRQLCVDHDHKTGEIRDLLCVGCNTGLGVFKENSTNLSRAIEYLAKHSRVIRAVA